MPPDLVYATLLSQRQPALLLAVDPSTQAEWLAGFRELQQQQYLGETVCSQDTVAGTSAGAAGAAGGAASGKGSGGGSSWCYAKVGHWWLCEVHLCSWPASCGTWLTAGVAFWDELPPDATGVCD